MTWRPRGERRARAGAEAGTRCRGPGNVRGHPELAEAKKDLPPAGVRGSVTDTSISDFWLSGP